MTRTIPTIRSSRLRSSSKCCTRGSSWSVGKLLMFLKNYFCLGKVPLLWREHRWPQCPFAGSWRYRCPHSPWARSAEHTSELQSRGQLVCRPLLEKKNTECTASNPAHT